jgi:blue light- and temperature-responsive anti-repressor
MTATAAATDHRTDLVIGFHPMIAKGSVQPFAWAAVATGACGRSFSALVAALAPVHRPMIEAQRISLAIRNAVAAGLLETDALLTIPLGAAAGLAEPLLSHLFRTALAHKLPLDRLVVEINADERGDVACVAALAEACTARGLSIALDGFAAGSVALKLLSRFTPRFVKLDPALIRNIDASASRRLIAESVMRLARNMGVTVIARGTESRGEHAALSAMGVRHFQVETPLPAAHQPRREPRTPSVQHRRLAHHQRAAFPLRAPSAGQHALAL